MQQRGLATRSERNLAFVAALIAGACWGVSFLAPRALPATSAGTLALFRFLFFGLSSIFALAIRRGRRPRISRAIAGPALALSLAGYSLYYTLLALGVKGIGIPFATAIIALLPLTILLAATPFHDWARLVVPIGLIAIGGALIPMALFGSAYGAFLERSLVERGLGLGATLGALVLWTVFAIRNAHFLKSHPEWNPVDWAGVLGVASGVTALGLYFLTKGGAGFADFSSAITDPRVLAWTGFMGIAGAWLATALWNYASRVLAPGALGMLLVFEAVFGLAFGFLYEHRGPTLVEGLAALCLISGALVGTWMLNPSDKSSGARNGSAG